MACLIEQSKSIVRSEVLRTGLRIIFEHCFFVKDEKEQALNKPFGDSNEPLTRNENSGDNCFYTLGWLFG
jgi:hypothetical protein